VLCIVVITVIIVEAISFLYSMLEINLENGNRNFSFAGNKI